MSERQNPRISERKQPRQARAESLVAAVLEAAVQVLRDEGAGRFTTARVAARAGVSVGSLYQYFPNKAAILFRLQSDEWRRTTAMLRDLLEDRTAPPPARLRALVHAFLRSERDEAAVRTALGDAAPLYRDAPEAAAARADGAGVLAAFVAEAAPGADDAAVALAAELVGVTLSQVGKRLAVPGDLDARADALADMLAAYLDRLGAGAA